MRPAYLLPLAALVLGTPRPAGADPPQRIALRLDYLRAPGAEGCPDENALHDAVARRMGYDPFEPSAPERLTVVLARQPRGFAARIERYAPNGTQTWAETFPIRGDDCGPLIAGIASEIRGLLIPVPGAPPPPARGRLFGVDGYTPPGPLAPEAPSTAPLPAPSSEPTTPRPRFELAATANVMLNGEPAVTGGATLRVAGRWPWASLGAEMRFDAPASTAAPGIPNAPNARVTAYSIAGVIAPCFLYPHPSIQPFGCLVGDTRVMTATGSGVTMPAPSQTHPIFEMGPRIGFDVPFGPHLALRASFDALFFPSAPHLVLAGSLVWRSPALSGAGSLGVAAFF